MVEKLLRAHELWEDYLKSHNVAEKLEHYSDEDIIKVLEEILNIKNK